jgi:hypothetical protein
VPLLLEVVRKRGRAVNLPLLHRRPHNRPLTQGVRPGLANVRCCRTVFGHARGLK